MLPLRYLLSFYDSCRQSLVDHMRGGGLPIGQDAIWCQNWVCWDIDNGEMVSFGTWRNTREQVQDQDLEGSHSPPLQHSVLFAFPIHIPHD